MVDFSASANSLLPCETSSRHFTYAASVSAYLTSFLSVSSPPPTRSPTSAASSSGSVETSLPSLSFSIALYAAVMSGLKYFMGVGMSPVMTSPVS